MACLATAIQAKRPLPGRTGRDLANTQSVDTIGEGFSQPMMPLKSSLKSAKTWLKGLIIGRQSQFKSTETSNHNVNALTQYPIQWVEK